MIATSKIWIKIQELTDRLIVIKIWQKQLWLEGLKITFHNEKLSQKDSS